MKVRIFDMKKYNICVLGATGLVGSEMLKILIERDFPFENMVLLASSRSAGTVSHAADRDIVVKDADEETFEGIDIALFAGGEIASGDYAAKAVKAGCVVIDNSAYFRMDPEVPLVVPEVNPDALEGHKGIIANPNCSTIQMVAALKPLYDRAGIERVVVATYQSVAGTGKAALEELKNQSADILEGRDARISCYPHRIAFSLIPQIGSFGVNGYSSEEMKMINETKKILGDDSVRVTATTVRVPVEFGHCESVNVQTKTKLSAKEAADILSSAPGVRVYDDPAASVYPMPIVCAGRDEVFVGRIREDLSIDNGIEMWIAADNIRKGAALNAVQIAEELIKRNLI
ncbi:MAG: aspartate-semialdehyde dehydrogenase [bacterium]|nr:aspartate-semialdehyde dehydrogenase [bacterium]